MAITHLKNTEIDKVRWDACIQHSLNGLIYAESVYLDHMCAGWEALVLDDYEAVMPLTCKKKWGIRYLYQPAFIQQGGIFFKEQLPVNLLYNFLKKAMTLFKFAEITVNYQNLINWNHSDIQTTERNNFILPLGEGYSVIAGNYNSYIVQRINRLQKFSLQYKPSSDYQAVTDLYYTLYRKRMHAVSKDDIQQFGKLCKKLSENNRVITRHVYNNDGTTLLAAVVLLRDGKRLYNIISCILPEGKKLLANYFMYDALIREFADESLIFDFEGSDIPGVAYFYNKFTGEKQQYAFLKYNRLPLLLRLLKS